MHRIFRSPSFRAIATAALLAFGLSVPAAGQQQPYVEKPYDPPVGSKWSIITERNSVELPSGGDRREDRTVMRTEMTIDQKLPDGFRVTYINRSADITGDTAAAKLAGDALRAMTDIPMHGRLDTAGRPVALENLAEVKTAMRMVVEKMVAKFEDNPKTADVIRGMLQPLLTAEGSEAATSYMEALTQLAPVQNAGIRPGDVRRDSENTSTPFGFGFKASLTTRLDGYDEKTGRARYIRKREFDKDSLSEAVNTILRRLASAAENKTITPEMMEMMKKVNFSLEGETVYDTDNGMTVHLVDRDFMSASVMGAIFTSQQKKAIAVTRMN
jgi:hypothetical protein